MEKCEQLQEWKDKVAKLAVVNANSASPSPKEPDVVSSAPSFDASSPSDGSSSSSSSSSSRLSLFRNVLAQQSASQSLSSALSSFPSSSSSSPRGQEGTIIFKLQKTGLDDVQFRMHSNAKLQKLFEVYASKNHLDMESMIFLFKGQRIQGDSTPSALGIRENDSIQVFDNPDWLFAKSSAPYVLKIVYHAGATVRTGVEIEGY